MFEYCDIDYMSSVPPAPRIISTRTPGRFFVFDINPEYLDWVIDRLCDCPDVLLCNRYPELKKCWDNYVIYLRLVKNLIIRDCMVILNMTNHAENVYSTQKKVHENIPGLKQLCDEYLDCLHKIKEKEGNP